MCAIVSLCETNSNRYIDVYNFLYNITAYKIFSIPMHIWHSFFLGIPVLPSDVIRCYYIMDKLMSNMGIRESLFVSTALTEYECDIGKTLEEIEIKVK